MEWFALTVQRRTCSARAVEPPPARVLVLTLPKRRGLALRRGEGRDYTSGLCQLTSPVSLSVLSVSFLGYEYQYNTPLPRVNTPVNTPLWEKSPRIFKFRHEQ